MRTYGIILLAALSAAAQEPSKPPPDAAAQTAPPKELDDALRARVSQFFQAHVDRKLRLAMEVVADESKDYFLDMDKPRYFGFNIVTISYSDEFTSAEVVVNCDVEIMIMGQGKTKVMAPLTTRWKIIDGNWFWFAKPSKGRLTPFGFMSAELPDPQAKNSQLPKPPVLPSGPQRVRVDKTGVVLNPSQASSDVVTVSNTLNGWVTVEVFLPELPGLTVKIDKKDVPPGGTGRIVFDYTPSGKPPEATKALLQVIPIRQAIPIGIAFKAAAEAKAAAPSPETQQQPVQIQSPRKGSRKR